jgi:hypothetical protein
MTLKAASNFLGAFAASLRSRYVLELVATVCFALLIWLTVRALSISRVSTCLSYPFPRQTNHSNRVLQMWSKSIQASFIKMLTIRRQDESGKGSSAIYCLSASPFDKLFYGYIDTLSRWWGHWRIISDFYPLRNSTPNHGRCRARRIAALMWLFRHDWRDRHGRVIMG